MAFKLPGFGASSIGHLLKIGTAGDLIGLSFNTAARIGGAVFMARVSENVTGFIVGVTAVSGTPTSAARADLYAVDSNGFPTGASLADVTWTPAAGVSTQTFGVAYAVTAGTCYAIVIKNIHATPASNNFAINTTASGSSTVGTYGSNLCIGSSDTGTTWTGVGVNLVQSMQGTMAIGVIYSTFGTDASHINCGTSYGAAALPLYNATSTRTARIANKINLEQDVLLWGATIPVAGNTGSPTFGIKAEVCSSSASLSSSDTVHNASALNSSLHPCWRWSVPYRLLAGQDYYIGLTPSEVGNGTAGIYHNVQRTLPILVTPTVGVIKGTYTSTNWDTPSWSQLATYNVFGVFDIEIPKPQQYFYAGMNGGFNG